jgi:hypothetical protein
MFALAQHNTFFFTENQEITGTEHNTFLQIRRRKNTRQKADGTESAGPGYCMHRGMRGHLNAHIYTIQ